MECSLTEEVSMARIPNQALVMVGDGSRAVFLRNNGTELEPDLAVEEVIEFDNPPTREQGTDRPTRGAEFSGGWTTNVGAPRGNIEQTDWHQLNEDRFARDIAGKLYELAHAGRFEQLLIVSPPKALGALRQALHAEVLRRVIAEIPKELARVPVAAMKEQLAALQWPTGN
jgi:protein required for attachment to host cells